MPRLKSHQPTRYATEAVHRENIAAVADELVKVERSCGWRQRGKARAARNARRRLADGLIVLSDPAWVVVSLPEHEARLLRRARGVVNLGGRLRTA